jgi:hypothetical protein
MVKRFLAAGALLAGIWAPAGAQVSVLDQLRGMANAPAANVMTPTSSPRSANVAAAVSAAEAALVTVRRTMESGMSPELRRFMDQKVFTAVIPPDMNIVDKVVDVMTKLYPPEEVPARIGDIKSSYAGRAEAGPVERVPQIPRGLTLDFDLGGGRVICFVGEENLEGHDEWDANGSRRWRVAVHELGHAVHRTFSDADWALLKPIAIDFYSSMPDPKDRYHEGDEKELFAEFTEVWFGVHQKDLRVKGWDAAQVVANDPPLAAFLEKVYGPARNVRP